ncbi:intracellular protein transport protein USO1-like [Nicotiana sylvestris]|uniref:intracellular protein transport protein USO1-like n=1 Tax=Nicotiana sylvestris TaxID=4096 RepID=UPI00388CB9DF
MLTTEYKLFGMKDDESIQDMHTRFTSIINELHLLGDVIPRNKLVRKILSVLPGFWESKVNAITEAKDLQTLTMDELIDNIVKQALAAWGDFSSESERELDAENISMMAVETEATNLVNDKEILTEELGEAEQSRDDLVVYVVDLNETIANLELEKEALIEKLTSVENERNNMMLVVVDLKETIEGLSNEKHSLEEKIASTEEERDDLLVICADLEETIEGLNREHRNVSLGKGKEVASESHILLEKELTAVKTSLCSELERNQQLQSELEKGKVRGSGLLWIMDNRYVKHAAKNNMNLFSLTALQEGNVSLRRK